MSSISNFPIMLSFIPFPLLTSVECFSAFLSLPNPIKDIHLPFTEWTKTEHPQNNTQNTSTFLFLNALYCVEPKMGVLGYRVSTLLLCIGFLLALQPQNVSAIRSRDLALRWDNVKLPFLGGFHISKALAQKGLQRNRLDLAPTPSVTFDPNQSNKRRVRRGSDPIHNKMLRF